MHARRRPDSLLDVDEHKLIRHETAPYISDDTVRFFVELPEAKNVSVVGSFNAWDKEAHPLRRIDMRWWVSAPIKVTAPNRHLYRFLVNGETFFDDPLNFNKTHNKHGPASYFDTWTDIPGMAAQLDGIHTSLLQNPPGVGNPWIREMCTIFVDDYLQQPNINRSSTMEKFFVRRVLTALGEIETTRVTQGVRVWHIYNHGYIFKTPKICFGVDVVTTRHIWNLAWNIPEEIPYRLAGVMDLMYVTHRHSDHADMELISRMIALNKPVIVQDLVRTQFPDGALGIESDTRKNIRGLIVFARPGIHVYDNGRNVPCVTYEITTDTGVRIYHTGDHDYAESLTWREPPDILIPKFDGVSPKYPNPKVLEILFSYGEPGLIIPGHINELAHYPLGGRTSLREAISQFQKCSAPYQILLWGESYFFS